MTVHHIDLSSAGIYGKMMMEYLEGNPQLRPYYSFSPSVAAIPDAIEARRKFPFYREELVTELKAQLGESLNTYPELLNNIQLLGDENTFTVTTGHQLCLATGPMFFIYKLISTINLCKELKLQYPAYNFVPVYWMATEDHDIGEINFLTLFDKVVKWETHQQGATGRLSTEGIQEAIKEIESLIENDSFAGEVMELLKNAYLRHQNMADATRELVLSLFGGSGLVVLDADKHSLKKLFAHVIKDELGLHNSYEIVTATNEKLSRNYKIQVTPREVNLFYLDEQLRERIIIDANGHYDVINTDLDFSREFILDLADKQPERFSPNVVLRPVYQETILPNLAYVGGPGEIAYWLQLKSLFEYFNVFYPMLIPRNNAVILPSKALEKFKNLGFELSDAFRTYDELAKQWLLNQEDLGGGIDDVKEKMRVSYEELMRLFSLADATLGPAVQAELQKQLNSLDNLHKKGTAALKRKHDVVLNQIRNLIERVNPAGEPQERVVNFLQFYAKKGPGFIDELLLHLHPLDQKLAVFVD